MSETLIVESPFASVFIFIVIGVVLHKLACHYGLDGSPTLYKDIAQLKVDRQTLIKNYESIKVELDEIKELAAKQKERITELQQQVINAAQEERRELIREIREQVKGQSNGQQGQDYRD